MPGCNVPNYEEITRMRFERAKTIASFGSLANALQAGCMPRRVGLTLSEAVVLGLLQQDVRSYLTVFGHGSTEIGEVLRIYQDAGLVRVTPVRNEIEASHAATALRWVSGQKAAVITSIGPGALQALAGSLTPASDGIGVWYLFGDETTEDEGFNMQQIPKHEQNLFHQLTQTLGHAYTLHTPLAISTALRRGQAVVDHPYRPGPFYLLLPMNVQPGWIPDFNLEELPAGALPGLGAAADGYAQAAAWIREAQRVVVKVGGGGRACGVELSKLLERADGVLVHTPVASGAVPAANSRNMGVGGSKGSICGNYAMENADLLVAVGTRAVCQSDCSRTGYPRVRRVININADLETAVHYGKTLALVGDAAKTLRALNEHLSLHPAKGGTTASVWLQECTEVRQAWQQHKAARFAVTALPDAYWGEAVLTQPVAIKTATDWAREKDVVTFFDAGDVQANGFQIVEDDRPGRTVTETGASYMGFAASALLATSLADPPFYALAVTGDGSFTMNPQILIDGAEHHARGCILLLDNGRMGAISGLQKDQYGAEFATWNRVKVDYTAWARGVQGVLGLDGGTTREQLRKALDDAYNFPGLALVCTRVYYGPHELGGLGVFGRWNVGNWVQDTQALRHEIGL